MKTIRPVTDSQKSRHPNWATIYEEVDYRELPWHSQTLDPDILASLRKVKLPINGVLWDVGCGDGSQAHALAALGYRVYGSDVSAAAIEIARRSQTRDSFSSRFVCADLKDRSWVESEMFDAVVDRGCFHVLGEDQRTDYLEAVCYGLRDGGVLVLKCFHKDDDHADPGVGPNRFSSADLINFFSHQFVTLSLDFCLFQGPRASQPKSLVGVFRKGK